jgi:large subunit ribosomal protein L18
MITKSRSIRRAKVKTRIALKIRGTSECPRLTVYRSLKHVYAQIIDDSQAKTLVSASSLTKEFQPQLGDAKGQKEVAKRLGKFLAAKAAASKVQKVVFDRNGYLYHGVVKSLADGAREGGLKF